MTKKENELQILFITTYYKPAYVYGGIVRAAAALCEALVKQGNHVTVYTTNANGPNLSQLLYPQTTNMDGVEVTIYPLGKLHYLFFSPTQIKAVLKNVRRFDLVFAQTLWQPLTPIIKFACKKSRIPYVVPLHGQLLPWSLKYHATRKSIFLKLFGFSYLNHSSALLCTDSEEEKAVKKLGLSAPTMVIPNGLNLSFYKLLPHRGRMRNDLGIEPELPIILFLGRLHPKKRPDIAIQVCANLHRIYHYKVHLIMAGPDEVGLLIDLKKQANELGIEDYVHFTGLVSDQRLLEVIVDSDVLIMPSESESENFGMSALEALFCGIPIIVSDGVPIGYWAEEMGVGKVLPCSPEAFTQAVSEMLSDPTNMRKMGERGSKLARQKFDSQVVASEMQMQIEAIVKTGKPSLESDRE